MYHRAAAPIQRRQAKFTRMAAMHFPPFYMWKGIRKTKWEQKKKQLLQKPTAIYPCKYKYEPSILYTDGSAIFLIWGWDGIADPESLEVK